MTTTEQVGIFLSLTELGNRLGPNGSHILFTAGGPIASLLSASSFLIMGNLLKPKHPKISSYLRCSAYMYFLHATDYASQAIGWVDPGFLYRKSHDFQELSRYGLNPLIPTIVYIVTPIFIDLAMGCSPLSWFTKKTRYTHRQTNIKKSK